MKMTKRAALVAVIAFAAGCGDARSSAESEQPIEELDPEDIYQPEFFEGVDEDDSADLEDGGDLSAYEIPTPEDVPHLEHPEIIVSLKKPLVVHLFDRTAGFSAVYPVGVGVIGSKGVSITPSGHFELGREDQTDGWYWVKRRTNPSYFAGFPFLRLSIENSVGANTYAFHGPITQTLKSDYVSHGCMRMAPPDVIELFWSLYYRQERRRGFVYEDGSHAPAGVVPVSIVPGNALDRAGQVLEPGATAELWAVDEKIDWPAMGAAERPEELAPNWTE
jgi:hypothetical protein